MTGWDGTDGQTDIGTDRLFSENIILDIVIPWQKLKSSTHGLKFLTMALYDEQKFAAGIDNSF